MEDLMKNDAGCDNLPGFTKLYIAFDSEVLSAELCDINTRNVVLKSGCTWGDSNGRKIMMNVSRSEGPNHIEISFFLQSSLTNIDYLLDRMCSHKCLAKLFARNGVWWLAGMPDEPLNMEYEHIGDSEVTGQHLYRVRLFRDTTYPLTKVAIP